MGSGRMDDGWEVGRWMGVGVCPTLVCPEPPCLALYLLLLGPEVTDLLLVLLMEPLHILPRLLQQVTLPQQLSILPPQHVHIVLQLGLVAQEPAVECVVEVGLLGHLLAPLQGVGVLLLQALQVRHGPHTLDLQPLVVGIQPVVGPLIKGRPVGREGQALPQFIPLSGHQPQLNGEVLHLLIHLSVGEEGWRGWRLPGGTHTAEGAAAF